ncbi:MAG: DUF3791 domain-containing protein [Treponema sp.]
MIFDKDKEDMQCAVFRLAQKNWNISSKKCSELFKQYNVLNYISECYGILHLSSYDNALNEIEIMMRNKGAKIC